MLVPRSLRALRARSRAAMQVHSDPVPYAGERAAHLVKCCSLRWCCRGRRPLCGALPPGRATLGCCARPSPEQLCRQRPSQFPVDAPAANYASSLVTILDTTGCNGHTIKHLPGRELFPVAERFHPTSPCLVFCAGRERESATLELSTRIPFSWDR